jgi:hypothetical protein
MVDDEFDYCIKRYLSVRGAHDSENACDGIMYIINSIAARYADADC